MDVCTSVKHYRKMKNPQPGRVDKKIAYGRIIKEETIAGYRFSLHATKGWRQMSPRRAKYH